MFKFVEALVGKKKYAATTWGNMSKIGYDIVIG